MDGKERLWREIKIDWCVTVHFLLGDVLTVGYENKKGSYVTLNSLAVEEGVELNPKCPVAHIRCVNETNFLLIPLVRKGHTRISVNGVEVDYSRHVSIESNSLLAFGRTNYGICFTVEYVPGIKRSIIQKCDELMDPLVERVWREEIVIERADAIKAPPWSSPTFSNRKTQRNE